MSIDNHAAHASMVLGMLVRLWHDGRMRSLCVQVSLDSIQPIQKAHQEALCVS